MTRFGVSIRTSVHPRSAEYFLGRLDEWSSTAGGFPAYVPIWHQLDNRVDPSIAAGIARGLPAGSELVIFLSTSRLTPKEILAGKADDELRALRDALPPGTIIRFDQEPNGDWPAPWAHWLASQYVDVWRHVHGLLSGHRMLWCPILERGNVDEVEADWRPYWPGPKYVSMVGFDMYAKPDEPGKEPADAWRRARRAVDALERIAPGLPRIICEIGIARGVKGRARWVRELSLIRDVDGIIYFDLDLRKGHLWGLGRWAQRNLGRLMGRGAASSVSSER